jgi:hypothetical protein
VLIYQDDIILFAKESQSKLIVIIFDICQLFNSFSLNIFVLYDNIADCSITSKIELTGQVIAQSLMVIAILVHEFVNIVFNCVVDIHPLKLTQVVYTGFHNGQLYDMVLFPV